MPKEKRTIQLFECCDCCGAVYPYGPSENNLCQGCKEDEELEASLERASEGDEW